MQSSIVPSRLKAKAAVSSMPVCQRLKWWNRLSHLDTELTHSRISV